VCTRRWSCSPSFAVTSASSVQIIAGRGLPGATVEIDAAPFRGALPLPYEQSRYGFANAVSEDEAKQLYATFAVPASGAPLFQAATANLNPRTAPMSTATTPTGDRC
jgi:hypothetical protein